MKPHLTISFHSSFFSFWRLQNPPFPAFSNPVFSSDYPFSVDPDPMAGHQDMDTSNPAVFVNAELLRLYVGRRVRALIQVIRSENGAVVGKSTDDSQIVVKGSPPRAPTTFVEVIGIADGDKSIRAEIWTNFGDAIDTHNYNQLCQLANGEFKHLFI